jgi:hypothetical protein
VGVTRSRAAYVLGIVMTTLGGLAFLLMAIIVGAVLLKGEAKDVVMAAMLGLFLLASGLPLAGGVWLLRRTDPELGARLRARSREFRAGALTPAGWRSLLLSPAGMALAFYIVSLVLVLVHHDVGSIVSFLLICAYGFWHPIRNLRRPHWWLDTAISFVAFFALTIGVAALTNLKEGAMVYLAPVMYYPAWVIVMGLVRFFSRLTSTPPSSETPLPPPS